MPSEFDPYREWLKIPPSEQPPHHYRLLGLKVFESDPQKIEEGITRLVGKLQSLSHGPRVKQAQELLNQVARARLCLADPDKKHQYDQELRTFLARQNKAPGNSPQTGPQSREISAGTSGAIAGGIAGEMGSAKQASRSTRSPGQPEVGDSGTPSSAMAWSATGSEAGRQSSSRLTDSPAPQTTSRGTVPLSGWQNWGVARQLAAGLLMSLLGGASGFLIVKYGLLPSRHSAPGVSQSESNQLGSPAPLASAPTPPLPVPAINGGSPISNAAVGIETQTPVAQRSPVGGKLPDNPTTTSIDQLAQQVLQELDQSSEPPTPATIQTPATTPPTTTPGLPGVYAPEHPSRFQDLLGTVIQLEGEALQVTSSLSGKTHYLLFSRNRSALLPVFAASSALEIEQLSPYVGKRIRVQGPIAKRGTEIGLEIKTIEQIAIMD